MSDVNSSLPIRTENPGDAIVKIADATVTSQQLKVNSDGSIDVNFAALAEIKITDGTDDLAINADGSINSVVSATDLDIRDLAFATDSVDVSGSSVTVSATDLDIRNLVFATDKVDVSGSSVTVSATDLDIRNLSASQDNIAISDGTDTLAVNADGSINSVVTATDLDIRDLTFATDKVDVSGSSVTVSATDLDIRDLAFATDKVDVSGSSVTVSATDLDIRNLSASQDNVAISDGTDSLAINTDGSINVRVLDKTPGTDVNDYNTAAAIAGGASSNHNYTSTGNFYLTQIESSGSGRMKIEVLVNAVSRFVQFNSTATPNMSIKLEQPILATTGQVVRVIRTNRENQAQDVYSTISGYTE